MVKGDMHLNIIEKGKPKEVIIKEGEVFMTCWMYQCKLVKTWMIIAVLYSCEINKELKKLKWYYGEIFNP